MQKLKRLLGELIFYNLLKVERRKKKNFSSTSIKTKVIKYPGSKLLEQFFEIIILNNCIYYTVIFVAHAYLLNF